MTRARLDDLRSVRKALSKSQAELARLLGMSKRAVQSYEQGWRPLPAYVQKLAGLFLYLKWRAQNIEPAPCWKVRDCPPAVRDACPAHEYHAGGLCWLVTDEQCRGTTCESWEAKLKTCRRCPLMKAWLGS
jgi:transcriptional regulator with XRE-family HTH domain